MRSTRAMLVGAVVMMVAGLTLAGMTPASAQAKLQCGAGGTGGKGSAGGWGVNGANGGSGTMPNCTQNVNGDASPTMNCHAGGDAGEVVQRDPKIKQGGAGGVAANIGSSGNVSARGGSEKEGTGGFALATPGSGSASADGHSGPGGVALGLGSGDAAANGGSKGSTSLGRAGDGGNGTMPQCMQNTNGSVASAVPAAAGYGTGGGVSPSAAKSAAGAKGAALGIGGGVSLAKTGAMTSTQVGVAGALFLFGGLLLLGAQRRPARRLG